MTTDEHCKQQIPKHPGYWATKDGKIWSKPRWGTKGGWLKLESTIRYLTVNLHHGGKGHRRAVHRIILEAFVGPCPNGMECRHLDGNPKNNQLSNLKWGTRSENRQDAVRHGTSSRGEQNGNAKLTDSIVALVRQLWNIRWMGITRRELAEMFGIGRSRMGSILNRKSWKHIRG